MAWPNDPRPARSLVTLRDQVNALSPNRDKSSDGMLASEAHTQVNPVSDHEPRVGDGGVGVVTALDISNDPAHGISSEALAEALRAAKDERIKYIISNKKIASGTGQGQPPWEWRPYPVPPNKNPHDHHVHISVKPDKALYDSTAPWTIALNPSAAQAGAASVAAKPVLRQGDQGADVVKLQNLLKAAGAALEANGQFDAATKAAVKQFQDGKGLFVDGVVGRHTWEALEQTA
jgi:hypothetical protein